MRPHSSRTKLIRRSLSGRKGATDAHCPQAPAAPSKKVPNGPLHRLLDRTSVKVGAGIQAREPQRQRQPAVEELALPSVEPAAAT